MAANVTATDLDAQIGGLEDLVAAATAPMAHIDLDEQQRRPGVAAESRVATATSSLSCCYSDNSETTLRPKPALNSSAGTTLSLSPPPGLTRPRLTSKSRTHVALPGFAWQYTSVGKVPGINGDTDLSALSPAALEVAQPAAQSYQAGDAVSLPIRSVNASTGPAWSAARICSRSGRATGCQAARSPSAPPGCRPA